jgi:uncharacterized protein
MVKDVERAKAFYKRIFNRTYVPSGPEYTLISTGAEPGGGIMQRPADVPMSSLNTYFRVPDVDKTLRDAVEAGATVIVPRMEVPAVGWFAMFLDPDQIPIGVMQLR